ESCRRSARRACSRRLSVSPRRLQWPECAQPRAGGAFPFLERGHGGIERLLAGRGDLVVPARWTLFLLSDPVILPARLHEPLVLESRQRRIHRAAGQTGGTDDVEAVAGAGSERLEHGN